MTHAREHAIPAAPTSSHFSAIQNPYTVKALQIGALGIPRALGPTFVSLLDR